MNRSKSTAYALGISTLVAMLFFVALQSTRAQSAAAAPASQGDPPALCRFGVNFNTEKSGPVSDITNYDIASLRAGWYIDYLAPVDPVRPGGVDYVHMIRLIQKPVAGTDTFTYTYSPSGNQLDTIISNNPGATWFIGNEPDRIEFQDGMNPDLYAEAYHELYYLIKEQDPTAKIFAGSIVQPTELRIEYLDLMLDYYEATYGELMPVDGWSIHNFILNERSCEAYNNDYQICWGADIPPGVDATDGLIITTDDLDRTTDVNLFIEQILRFRRWMGVRGYAGVPVYLSEYGVLLPDIYGGADLSAAAVNRFMSQTFDYALTATDPDLGDPTDGYRLVQRLSWYSVNDDVDIDAQDYQYNGWLFDPDTYARSEMGDNYAAYTAALSATVDLYPAAFQVDPPFFNGSGEPISVTLRALIANSGNTLAAHDAVVRFYNGDPDAGGEQIGEDHSVSLAGCGDDVLIETVWANAVPGVYDLHVDVVPVNGTEDANEVNNLRQRLFFTSTGQIYLPLTSKELLAQ